MTSVALPGTTNGSTTSYTHVVSRSSELLSCAKTALKIAKAQHAQNDDHGGTMWWACQDIQDLQLCVWKDRVGESPTGRHLEGLCEDGLSLLRAMDVELTQLEQLVRRRGHTNDPTEEIAASVRRLETDAKELSMLVKTGFSFPKASAHYQRHTELIATWLQTVATQQTSKLKEILKVRGNVLADQAQRRKLLSPDSADNKDNKSRTASSKPVVPPTMDTPLFSLPPIQKPPSKAASIPNGSRNGGSTNGMPRGYGGGAAGYGGGAYGGSSSYYGSSGGYGGSATTGMRQRRQPKAVSMHHQQEHQLTEEDEIQMQIQQRQQQRQTEMRLQEAQQVEGTLAELGTMFSKMTNLISQQGEVLEKIEDDVESGLDYVTAGQQEITTLYSIKKGNRGLIIKVFGLLIFLIIFMRFYKK